MRVRTLSIVAVAALMAGVVWAQGRGNPTDWPTASGDAQRTSWVRSDVNISPDTMDQPGFALQWKTTLESPLRQGVSLSAGVVTSAVNLFTPISTIAGPSNVVFAVDNDTGNVFWTRRFDGAIPPATAACPGGISGAPTRMVNLVIPPPGPARGAGGRAGRTYSGAVGEPGAGVPIPAPGARGGGRGPGGGAAGAPAGVPPAAQPQGLPARTGGAAPAAPPPASPFPTNAAAVAAAGGGGGNLFRSSGVVYVVSADGMLRTLGLVSGKDVQRPTPFLPSGARSSDLIGVSGMVYAATSEGCGGAARGIWAVNTAVETKPVVSWKTNGGNPIGSVAFTTTGTLIAAIGPGAVTTGGYANAIVALDPKTLELKDWFTQPGTEFAAAPVILDDNGRNIVAVTTKEGRLLFLDAMSLGGANHATPLFASAPLLGGRATFSAQSPAMWRERPPTASDGAAPPDGGGTRWLLMPVTGPVAAGPGVTANGTVSTGAVLAVKVTHQNGSLAVQPGWLSENIAAPITAIVVNGVVFAASGPGNAPARLYALDGTNGKTMWQSGGAISAPLSARSFWTGSGHVFVGTRDGTIYAFGFDMERGTPRQRSGS